MAHIPFFVLHGGGGLEPTLLEYLVRAFVHLVAFGAVAGCAYRGVDVAGAVRSAFVGEPESDGAET